MRAPFTPEPRRTWRFRRSGVLPEPIPNAHDGGDHICVALTPTDFYLVLVASGKAMLKVVIVRVAGNVAKAVVENAAVLGLLQGRQHRWAAHLHRLVLHQMLALVATLVVRAADLGPRRLRLCSDKGGLFGCLVRMANRNHAVFD